MSAENGRDRDLEEKISVFDLSHWISIQTPSSKQFPVEQFMEYLIIYDQEYTTVIAAAASFKRFKLFCA